MPISRKAQDTVKNVPNRRYYQVAAVISDPKFQESINWLKERFEEIGCPIPKNGFKTYQEYLNWNGRFWSTYVRMDQSKELKDKIAAIPKNKDSLTWEEYERIEKLKKEFLPPVYGKYLEEVLHEFGLDKDDKEFQDFIDGYVFFGKTEFQTTFLKVIWKREKDDQAHLYLELFPHTKLEHIQHFWPEIEKDMAHFPEYKPRYKTWEDFDRNLFIYQIYQEAKARQGSLKKKRNKYSGTSDTRLEMEVLREIKKKNPKAKDLSFEAIRKIISRTETRIGKSDR